MDAILNDEVFEAYGMDKAAMTPEEIADFLGQIKEDEEITISVTPSQAQSSESICEVDAPKQTEEKFSMWIQSGDDFTPAVDTQIVNQLPSGVYKFVERQDEIHLVKGKVKTDKLYTFSESSSDKLLKEIKTFWDRKDVYAKYEVLHKRGILLEGAPGGGKTACISLLAKDLIEHQNGLIIAINSVRELYYLFECGNSIIRKIEPDRPIITIIEDVDQFIAKGDTAILLDLLDGKASIDHHVVIMTSNDTTGLPESLLRPSRIDLRCIVENPSEAVRKEYFANKGVPEEKLEQFIKYSNGMSFAEMKELFVGVMILGKAITKVADQIKNPEKTKDYLMKKTKKIEV